MDSRVDTQVRSPLLVFVASLSLASLLFAVLVLCSHCVLCAGLARSCILSHLGPSQATGPEVDVDDSDASADRSTITQINEGYQSEEDVAAVECKDSEDKSCKSKSKKRKRPTAKATSRKAKGGSGAMEGDQELDYEVVKRNYMPVPFCADAQFEEHKKAVVVDIHPSKILYTDEASCALDAYNMGANPAEPIARAELEGDAGGSTASAAPVLPLGVCGEAPSSATPSPLEGASVGGGVVEPKAVNLGHACMVKAMKVRGHVLEPVGSKAAPPKLQRVLKQKRGIFLVEFHWINKEGERNHHVIAVNCGLRLVFCNTLGALPVTLADKVGKWNERETAATHDNVASRFHIQSVTRVWRVLRKA